MKDLADPDIEPASDADLRTLAWDAAEAEALAEEAEAAAAEAKAVAVAARARTRATRMRLRAEAAGAPIDADAATAAESAAPDDGKKTGDDARSAAPAEAESADDAATDSIAEPDAEPAESVSSEAVAAGADSGTVEPAPLSRGARLRAGLTRAPRRTAMVAASLVLIAASVATSAVTVWHHHQLAQQTSRRGEFTAAARQGVVALTSMDFNHAKDDVQRVLENSTGAFHDDFAGRADDFTKVVQQSQVTTEGKVDSAAVESMSGDSAVVLVAATSRITNSAGAQQEPRVWRLSVTVTRVGGRLLMSKVEFVP